MCWGILWHLLLLWVEERHSHGVFPTVSVNNFIVVEGNVLMEIKKDGGVETVLQHRKLN